MANQYWLKKTDIRKPAAWLTKWLSSAERRNRRQQKAAKWRQMAAAVSRLWHRLAAKKMKAGVSWRRRSENETAMCEENATSSAKKT